MAYTSVMFTRTMKTRSLLVTGAVFGISASAEAVPTYPTTIQDALDLDAAPACTLCHSTPAGGAGTATTPVAMTLSEFGLTGSPATLLDALAEFEGELPDSDGDGVNDLDELLDGTDPNVEDAEEESDDDAEDDSDDDSEEESDDDSDDSEEESDEDSEDSEEESDEDSEDAEEESDEDSEEAEEESEDDSDDSDSGGCNVAPGSNTPGPMGALLVALGLAFGLRKRRH